MKKYQSFKIVEAGVITAIGSTHPVTSMTTLHVTGEKEGEIEHQLVSYDWVIKHSDNIPKNLLGGYLVKYEDGYTSWSPAVAFEGGYKLVN